MVHPVPTSAQHGTAVRRRCPKRARARPAGRKEKEPTEDECTTTYALCKVIMQGWLCKVGARVGCDSAATRPGLFCHLLCCLALVKQHNTLVLATLHRPQPARSSHECVLPRQADQLRVRPSEGVAFITSFRLPLHEPRGLALFDVFSLAPRGRWAPSSRAPRSRPLGVPLENSGVRQLQLLLLGKLRPLCSALEVKVWRGKRVASSLLA